MPLPKQTPLREIIRRVRLFGFEGPKSGGGHGRHMVKGPRKVSLPQHHSENKEIGRELLKKFLAKAGISHEDWIAAGTKQKAGKDDDKDDQVRPSIDHQDQDD